MHTVPYKIDKLTCNSLITTCKEFQFIGGNKVVTRLLRGYYKVVKLYHKVNMQYTVRINK